LPMRPCPADTWPRFFRFFFRLVVISAARRRRRRVLVLEGEEAWWEETLGEGRCYLSYKAGAWRGRRRMGEVADLEQLDWMGHGQCFLLGFFLGLQLYRLWAGPFSSELVGLAVRPSKKNC
jgi:hypothetical protein